MQIRREIVSFRRGFQSALHSTESTIIRLDTTLPVVSLNVLASPLSIISALVAPAAHRLNQSPVLAFFCAKKLPVGTAAPPPSN